MEKFRPTLSQLEADAARTTTIIEQRSNFSERLLMDGTGPYTMGGERIEEGTSIEHDIFIGEKREKAAKRVAASITDRLAPEVMQLQAEIADQYAMIAEAEKYERDASSF